MSRSGGRRGLFRWLGKQAARVLVILAVITLLPYASRLADRWLAGMTDRAVNTTVILSEKLTAASRLETTHIRNESVVDSSTSALFLGTVRRVQIQYVYEASIGIDLSRVRMETEGSVITFVLPQPEILTDSLTPVSIVRDDFWYPMTDAQQQRLLEKEKEKCRADYLQQVSVDGVLWNDTVFAFENTIASWINLDGGLEFVYRQEEGTE